METLQLVRTLRACFTREKSYRMRMALTLWKQALALAETVISRGIATTENSSNVGMATRAAQIEFREDPDAERKIAALAVDSKDFIILIPARGGARNVAGRALWAGCEGTREGWIAFGYQLRAAREELAAAVEAASAGAARKIRAPIL